MRSKAYWGYDAAFLEACRKELTITPDHINSHLIIADAGEVLAGVAQVAQLGPDADLLLFFVDPPFIGQGIGKLLFDWSVQASNQIGARNLMIDADPGAEGFYLNMGARRTGERASSSIPGRMLPLLEYALKRKKV